MNKLSIPFISRLLFITFAVTRFATAEVSLEDGIKARLGELTKKELPGVAVLVARDGKVAFQGGFGMADVDRKTPVTVETKFRIGSVTKQFTAAAILKLAEEGKLSLTDPLKKFFPDFPGAGGITLHQLLTHTSGIHSYTSKPEFIGRVTKPIEPGKLIEWFQNDPLDFAPGAGFLYNNSAYFLTGELVAKVSGKSYAAFLAETFFEPLGMKNTGVYVNASPPAGMATGYSVTDKKAAAALDWDMSWAGGAGALYSTVGDMLRWSEALFGGKILKEASYKEMITPVKLAEGVDGMVYGCGLLLSEVRRLPAIGHGGGLNGWSSDLIYFPQQHCTIVALSNAMPGAPGFEPAGIARSIAEKFLAEDIKKLPPVKEDTTVDKKTYAGLAGRYDYKNAVMTVSVENDRVYAQLTGQPKNEIFPSGPDQFFWKVTDARVTFLRDAKGVVTAARHTQGGSTFKAPRLEEAAVKLTAAELDAVVGKYQYGPLGVLTVSRDGDSVFAQLTGQQKFPIFAKSALEFEWRVVKASVRFEKDKDGNVTKAHHTQNGSTFEAARMK
ncbi:MAG TPA: serine hydrolase [Verrucomicrobiales bacterium]|nr:serine hydrolase [Verrucomicrobiales bacterium]